MDLGHVRALGIGDCDPWLDADTIRRNAWRHLPDPIRSWADRALMAWAELPPDPHGETYGHFDAHGWNMAFDMRSGRLAGVFDFGDSGFGPVHREFVYSMLIDVDLTGRIIASYERHSGRSIDRERVLLLADIHRLWEIAVEHEDGASVAAMLEEVVPWAMARR
ncbi:phosphotransferase [Devosia sediminis]|uniref:phosphotransferase n=1 Tax=Devosia sediminis TaxID=2798801 RepID=UPI002E28F28B|nr:phosphotransferase [Devosia sediminis]